MNIKHLFVLTIGILVACWFIENPPMMAGTGINPAQVIDDRRLQDSLAIDLLVTIVLMLACINRPAKAKRKAQDASAYGYADPFASDIPAVSPGYPRAEPVSDLLARQYRPPGLHSRALVVPMVIVIALGLLGCYLLVDNLQRPPEYSPEAARGTLSRP